MTLFTREFLELHFCDKDGKIDCGDDLWINKALDNQDDALRFQEVPLSIRENIKIVERLENRIKELEDMKTDDLLTEDTIHDLREILRGKEFERLGY